MNARKLMTPHPITIEPTDLINEAAGRMASLGLGFLPVVDLSDSGKVLGVLTDRDIACRCTAKSHDPSTCQVRDHMTSEGIGTVHELADLGDIAEAMLRLQVRRVPVVDDHGRLVGVVSQADMARRVGPTNPELVEDVLEGVSAPRPL